MAPKKNTPPPSDTLPFGAGALDPVEDPRGEAPRARKASAAPKAEKAPKAPKEEEKPRRRSAPKAGKADSETESETRPARATRTRRKAASVDSEPEPALAPEPAEPKRKEDGPVRAAERPRANKERAPGAQEEERDRSPAPEEPRTQEGPVDSSTVPPRRSGRAERRRRWQERRRRRRLGLPLDDLAPGAAPARGPDSGGGEPARSAPPRRGGHDSRSDSRSDSRPRERERAPQPQAELQEVEGLLIFEKVGHAHLRSAENSFLPSKNDIHVAPWQVQKFALREGSMVRGRCRRGQGRNKWDLVDVLAVDGQDPRELRNTPIFKNLTTIDPDFHYAMGDESGETSLKVVDLLAPIGRGQRGLIVASPRSGKTILLQQIAKAVEKIYPDVELMVLLLDERPEEATEWKRTLAPGKVFVSTNDEPAKRHVELAEVVWRRARRLVELGKDVILLLDSITRLGRAANNVWGTSGKTMSGGIDSRALERPKQFFGSARNTETAGSLTILATALVDTGSRMDQVIFEEFKGTGNMELVLSRKLADRRIFPAIDIEKTGTRKEEKLHSTRRMARVNTLRRVLMRMHWAEAMELLITKLDDVEKIDDFLQRFEIDPDAGDEGKQAVSPVRMRW